MTSSWRCPPKTWRLAEYYETVGRTDRIVIELRHTKEMEYQDIAEMLELPLGTVKAHLFRARALLAKRLQGKMVHFQEQ